jgi:2-polyprenyl-3-methyl-5-hydroxy-6-metoxy-1,4-benzoquinol methylase
MITEKIEILSVELLDQHRARVENLRQLAGSLRIEFGWHYLLDIVWILHHLEESVGDVDGMRISDAGAGVGLMQWYLAQSGATVISIDRSGRENLPLFYRARYQVEGLRPVDLAPPLPTLLNGWRTTTGARARIGRALRDLLALPRIGTTSRQRGKVVIYNQDLKNLNEIPDESLDAVVAVSALEHNPPENLQIVVNELMRTVKKNGVLIATLGAAEGQDWYHEPSSGWNYTAQSLRRAFSLAKDVPSNYQDYSDLLSALRNCVELRENLASFYFASGNNGMPWGKWDPKYQPVGVVKIKH